MSLSSGFSKLSVLDALEFAKTKSLHNCVMVVTRYSKFVTLWCPAQKKDPGTLEVCQSPYPITLPCLSRVPATDSLSIHWVPQPACRPHAHQCKCPVPCSQTNKDRSHLEQNHVLFNLPDKCCCQRLEDVLRPSMVRWLCVQLFRLRGLQR